MNRIYDEYDRPDTQILGKFLGCRAIDNRIHNLGEDFRMSLAAAPFFLRRRCVGIRWRNSSTCGRAMIIFASAVKVDSMTLRSC